VAPQVSARMALIHANGGILLHDRVCGFSRSRVNGDFAPVVQIEERSWLGSFLTMSPVYRTSIIPVFGPETVSNSCSTSSDGQHIVSGMRAKSATTNSCAGWPRSGFHAEAKTVRGFLEGYS